MMPSSATGGRRKQGPEILHLARGNSLQVFQTHIPPLFFSDISFSCQTSRIAPQYSSDRTNLLKGIIRVFF